MHVCKMFPHYWCKVNTFKKCEVDVHVHPHFDEMDNVDFTDGLLSNAGIFHDAC